MPTGAGLYAAYHVRTAVFTWNHAVSEFVKVTHIPENPLVHDNDPVGLTYVFEHINAKVQTIQLSLLLLLP